MFRRCIQRSGIFGCDAVACASFDLGRAQVQQNSRRCSSLVVLSVHRRRTLLGCACFAVSFHRVSIICYRSPVSKRFGHGANYVHSMHALTAADATALHRPAHVLHGLLVLLLLNCSILVTISRWSFRVPRVVAEPEQPLLRNRSRRVNGQRHCAVRVPACLLLKCDAHVFTRFSPRYLPYAVCAVLFLLELGLLKLVQSTRRYQKLAVWISEYQQNYRLSTISSAQIELPDITDPKNDLL